MGTTISPIRIYRDEPDFQNENIEGNTIITVAPTDTAVGNNTSTTPINQGDNNSNPPPQVGTANNAPNIITNPNTGTSSTTSSTESTKVIGETKNGGVFTPVKQNELPTIYFNFKKNVFTNDDLIFRFKTSNLTSTDLTGNAISNWASDTNLSTSFSLTSSSKLKVVKAYDKYFYELLNNSVITNSSVTLNVSQTPSYNILVFALGADSLNNDENICIYNLYKNTNQIHTFAENYNLDSGNNTLFTNIGTSNIENKNYNKKNYYTCFSGGVLNSKKYVPNVNSFNLVNPKQQFYTNFQSFNNNSDITYNPFRTFNLRNLRTDLANPTTVQNFQLFTHPTDPATAMQMFSLFFVEMFTYLDSSDTSGKNLNLRFETFINGQKTFQGKYLLKDNSVFTGTANYLISLSNKNYLSQASSRMFLFDYLYGSSYSLERAKQKSRSIIEGLCYDYRNIMLKSTSDLQLSNGTKSLLFSPNIPHPFLNMYFMSATT